MEGLVKNRDYHIDEKDKTLRIHEGVTVIPHAVFQDNKDFIYVEFPKTLVRIESDAFKGTDLITLYIPESVEYIGSSAFRDCRNLVIVNIPNGIKVINSLVFSNTNISILVLPQTLEVIGHGAFSKLNSNAIIELPESLRILGDRSFYTGNNISVTLNKGLKYVGVSAVSDANVSNNKLPISLEVYEEEQGIVPNKKGESYYIKGKTLYICDGVKYVYNNCEQISENDIDKIVFPNSVVYIGSNCANSSNIKEIEMSSNIEYIGECAFSYCEIQGMILPDTLKYIGKSAFSSCKTKVRIPSTCSYDDHDNYETSLTKYQSSIKYSELIENEKAELNELRLSPEQIEKNSKKINIPFEASSLSKDLFSSIYKIVTDCNYDEKRHMSIIESFIKSNEITQEQYDYLLKALIERNYIETILMFIRYGYDFMNNNTLSLAVVNRNDELIRILLMLGVNINEVDSINRTPLLNSVILDDEVLVKMLLDNGADVSISDKFGYTPIEYAREANNCNMINLLLNKTERKEVDTEADLNALRMLLEK